LDLQTELGERAPVAVERALVAVNRSQRPLELRPVFAPDKPIRRFAFRPASAQSLIQRFYETILNFPSASI
jgi:hypothetical protein